MYDRIVPVPVVQPTPYHFEKLKKLIGTSLTGLLWRPNLSPVKFIILVHFAHDFAPFLRF